MMYAESVLKKYKAVCSLADAGSDGERSNAQSIKIKMEKKHPGIDQQLQWQKRNEETNTESPGPASSPESFDDSHAFHGNPFSQFEWTDFAQKAGDFFSKFRDFTETAIGLQVAKEMAKNASITLRHNPTGSVSLTFRLQPEQLDRLEMLSAEQKFAFIEEAAQQFADQLAYIVYDDVVYDE